VSSKRKYSIIDKLAFRIYCVFTFADIRFTRWVRRKCLSFLLQSRLTGLIVDRTVYLSGIENLSLGSNVSIHQWSFISAEGGLSIGDNVSIGHRCSILTTEHEFRDKARPIKSQPLAYLPVSICENVWVGANVTILAGVSLPRGTVVAAGAVVTRSVEDEYSIVAGVPARVIARY